MGLHSLEGKLTRSPSGHNLHRNKISPLTWGCCARAVNAAWSEALRATATTHSALGTRLTCTTLRTAWITYSVVRRIAVCTPLSERVTDCAPQFCAGSADKPPAALAQKAAHNGAAGPHTDPHAPAANTATPALVSAAKLAHTAVVIMVACEPQYVCWYLQSGHVWKHTPVWLQVLNCLRVN